MLSANFSKRILTLSVISNFIFSTIASAAPTGATVVAGDAAIGQSGNQTVINQTSQNTVINWSKFDTASHESVIFQQPNASAIALNRVTSGLPTNYSGLLSANGQVWIINPAGVLFTSTSRIDVAGLVASTRDISNDNFKAGKYTFDTVPGFEKAKIINNGRITAKEAGIVALLASGVENNGIIEAYLGKVALSSGVSFVLDLYGDQLIHFGSNEKVQEGYVSNAGTIKADGGKVLVTAHSVSQMLDDVISMSGVIEAKAVTTGQRGEIILHSYESSGKVNVTGTLDVSNKANPSSVGFIETSGHEVDVNKATINAGVGGTWLLDPLNITIVSGNGLNTTPGTSTIGTNLITAQLNAGTNVILDANVPGTGAGNIKITAPITHSQASGLSPTLTLNAVGTVTFSGVSPILSTGAIPLNVVMNGSSIAVSQPINVGTGSVALNALATTVTQTAAGIITASSLTTTSKTGTSLATATNAVSNFNAANVTSGAISLKNNGPLNITGINQTGGNLAITNTTGAISQSGQLSVSGTSNFNAGANAIALNGNNTFTGAVTLTSSNNVSINNNTNLSLAASTVGGNLIVTTNNSAITQTGVLTIGGSSNFNAGSGLINLSTSSNAFSGTVTLLTSNNTSIKNNIALSLASSTIGGNLAVSTTNDAITQTGALSVGGTSSFNAGSNLIDLSTNGSGNHFVGAVSLLNSGAFDVSINNAVNLVLGTSAVGRNLSVTSNNNSITQSGILTVAGLSSFNSGTNYIDLSTSNNALKGAVSFSSGSDTRVLNNIGLVFGNSTIGGNLIASTTNDAITQIGALSVQGASNFDAGTNKIDLLTNGSGNQFFGAVSFSNTGAFDVSIQNSRDLVLGVSNIGRNFKVISNNNAITQIDGLSVGGTSNFNAGSNAINLLGSNHFTGAVALTSSSNVSINNNINLSLAASTIAGDLAVTTNNAAITQTGVLTVSGASRFDAGSNTINLSTKNNVFTGAVTLLTSSNASIKNNIALNLGESSVGGNLVASTTNDAITQTGALQVGGTSSFSAGANTIDLSNPENHFASAVMLSNSGVFDVSVHNASDLVLGTTKIGRNLTVTTNNGSITQSGIVTVAGLSSFNSGTNYIDLSTSANAFAKAISFTSGSHVAIKNNNALVLGASTIGGNLTASTTNDAITQAGALSVQGISNFNAGTNKIDLLTNGMGNQFFGAVSFFNQGNFDVSIQNSRDLVLGASSIGRNFKVISNNNAITQIDGLSVGGTSNFNAGSNVINLSGNNNFTGAITLNNSGANNDVTLINNRSSVLSTSTVGGVLKIISGGNLTLNGVLKSNASSGQRSIILSANNLINNKNASVLSPGLNNTFAIYLRDPSTSLFKGLASGNQAIWNNTLSTLSPENLPAGNRYVFSTQPMLTVTTLDISKIYGTDLTNAMGSLFTVSGFVNAASYGNVFKQDTVANTLENTATTSVGALPTASVLGGPYAVISNATATKGYGVVLQNSGNITVTPASLSITSSGQTKTYGQTLSGTTTSFSSLGLKNNETVGTVDIISNGLVPTATVIGGPYAITEVSNASGGTFDKNNYVITYNPFATITVNKAPLIITANNHNKLFGQTFSFAGTEFVSTGLLNSDTVSSVRLNSVGDSSPYLIRPSDAIGTGLSNYSIQYVDGLLIVNSASIVPVVDFKKKMDRNFMSSDSHLTLIAVGEVMRVSGEVMAVNGKDAARPLAVGRKIYLGSKIVAEGEESSADIRTLTGDIIRIDYDRPYSF